MDLHEREQARKEIIQNLNLEDDEEGVKYRNGFLYKERQEGKQEAIQEIVEEKLRKGKSPAEIADALEKSEEYILEIISLLIK